MKKTWIRICLAVLLTAILSGCTGKASSLESQLWSMSFALTEETGKIVACSPQLAESYPQASIRTITCQAKDGQWQISEENSQKFQGSYELMEQTAEGSLIYTFHFSDGRSGTAVYSLTDHRSGESIPTLVLSLPQSYTLYFHGSAL